ncbi:MAG: bifunctional riboflavin kinase/FAD synthetase [Aeromicrobium sp.]|uniref:bifunctional riboflavin kinase/FAD synthetase n=1 Tax=Aeromicrobium sp. TaxID=1871063 RepID=UPI0039E446D0
MAIWREVDGADTAPFAEPTVVTIGTFDGVHLGHQSLLARACEVAEERPIVAVTFDPHPVAVFAPDRVPALLTGIERRVELLRAEGAGEVRVLAFSREMAVWSPEEFVRRVLIEDLRAAHVVVGENFTYGSKASGDVATLTRFGAEHGFAVDALPLAGDAQEYSSSLVRRLVAGGDVAAAARILGRPAEVSGVVTRGDQRGRDLGFPTANVPVASGFAVPGDGVYAAWVVPLSQDAGQRWPAAVSVGDNPTFDGTERRVEAYVLDRTDLDLYDQEIRVEFVQRLRGMEAFGSVEALVEQMHADVAAARRALGLPPA